MSCHVPDTSAVRSAVNASDERTSSELSALNGSDTDLIQQAPGNFPSGTSMKYRPSSILMPASVSVFVNTSVKFLT